MKQSLRTARKLDTKITNYLYATRLATGVSVSIYNELPETTLEEAREEGLIALNNQLRLLDIRNGIRRTIQSANEAAGINQLIADRKISLDKIAVLTTATQRDYQDSKVLLNKLKALTEKPNDNLYGNRDSVEFPVLETSTVNNLVENILEHKTIVENIDEQLLALNAGTKISVNDDDITFLQQLKII